MPTAEVISLVINKSIDRKVVGSYCDGFSFNGSLVLVMLEVHCPV